MSVEQTLKARSQDQCELCSSKNNLSVYEVPPVDGANSDKSVYLCETCLSQIESTQALDTGHHWRCLNDSM